MSSKTLTKDELELIILIALFQTTVEQQSMLIGKHKHQTKLIFNKWIKMGNKLMQSLQDNVIDEDLMDIITDRLHDGIKDLREAVVATPSNDVNTIFNDSKFRSDLHKIRVVDRNINLRDASDEIGISKDLLSKAARGKKIDSSDLMLIVKWMKTDINDYFKIKIIDDGKVL